MVVLERHPLVHRRVDLDIYIVPDLVRPQVGRQRDETLLPEAPREQVSRPGAEPVSGRHGFRTWVRRPPWRDVQAERGGRGSSLSSLFPLLDMSRLEGYAPWSNLPAFRTL